MNVTLRIKRVYFDQILDGSKTIEYRDARSHYDKIFKHAERVKTLTLHYQGKRKLKCDVVAISRVRTPRWLKRLAIEFGSHTYAIIVRNPRLA